MSSYVRESLLDGEKILYEGAVSLWAILPKLLAGLLLLPVFGYGLVLWISASIYYSSTELCVTNRRVVARLGLIRRRIVEFHIAKVESVRIEQGLFGRMFDFGTITVLGTGENGDPVRGIDDPVAFRRALLQVQEIVLRRTGAAFAPARARMMEEAEGLRLPTPPPERNRESQNQNQNQNQSQRQRQPQPRVPVPAAPPAPPPRRAAPPSTAEGWPDDDPFEDRPPPARSRQGRGAAFSPTPVRQGPTPGEWD